MNPASEAVFQSLLHAHLASVLCRNPLVVAVFNRDFALNLDTLAAFVRPHPKAVILVQLGWEHETAPQADSLGSEVARFRELAPGARVVVLCNSPREREPLGARGVETILANHNAFLDERRYRPLPAAKSYAAVYTARLTPFKRHGLLPPDLADRILCIGCRFPPDERDYADSMHARFPEVTWVERFSGARISTLLARARCGLALSAAEGACFASSEYLMCGLPVVDTPALGGRDVLYPPEFVASVDATPAAVAAGIERWMAAPPDPWRVRAAWLARAEPHRRAFRDLMRGLTGRDLGRPPHRLGVWTPHPGLAMTLAVATANGAIAALRRMVPRKEGRAT